MRERLRHGIHLPFTPSNKDEPKWSDGIDPARSKPVGYPRHSRARTPDPLSDPPIRTRSRRRLHARCRSRNHRLHRSLHCSPLLLQQCQAMTTQGTYPMNVDFLSGVGPYWTFRTKIRFSHPHERLLEIWERNGINTVTNVHLMARNATRTFKSIETAKATSF